MWTEQRLKKYREKAEISRFKPFEHEIRWRGYKMAPNCGFHTAGHPLDVEQRNQGLEYAYPITIGDNVWIGAGVTVLPGVTIGNNAVIGAGSVVNRDIPDGVVAAGNPCRVIRRITDADREKYKIRHC